MENFVFQFGAEIFSMEFLLRNLGYFLLLVHPLWPRSPGIVALFRQSICSSHPFILLACLFFLISDELVLFKIWAHQSFTQLIVQKEPRVGDVEVSRI